MDQYYADIARELINKAEAELIKAQSYLAKAQAPGYLIKSAQRATTSLRTMQDEINRIERNDALAPRRVR